MSILKSSYFVLNISFHSGPSSSFNDDLPPQHCSSSSSSSTVLLLIDLLLRRVSGPVSRFEMRSRLDLEDLDEAVFSGRVSGVDVAEDQFQAAFVEEALDESVEVIFVEIAASTVGFAHHVHDIASGTRQLHHLPEGGGRQVSLGETAGASQSVVLSD